MASVDWSRLITVEDKQPAPPVLTPRQFTWLLAYTALEDVWGAIEAHAKQNNRPLYANLRAQRHSGAFILDVTLAFKNRPEVLAIAAQVAPEADLSDAAITAAWMEAAAFSGEALSGVEGG